MDEEEAKKNIHEYVTVIGKLALLFNLQVLCGSLDTAVSWKLEV